MYAHVVASVRRGECLLVLCLVMTLSVYNDPRNCSEGQDTRLQLRRLSLVSFYKLMHDLDIHGRYSGEGEVEITLSSAILVQPVGLQ